MQRPCKSCGSEFEVTDQDLAFYDKVSPVFGGKKYGIPPPTHCPDCRQQRRVAQANQLHLYRRSCDLTGEPIVSNYHPNAPYKVYRQQEWHSDAWDPIAYGREIDFSRTFFEQFDELLHDVPHPCLLTAYEYDENSEYTNHAGKNKNCYLIFDSDENRDCYYSYSINKSESCMDCFRVRRGERCYECVDCVHCYGSSFLQDCVDCSDSALLKNCIGCRHCLMCSNLHSKEYHIRNAPVSKQQFEEVMTALRSRSQLEELHAEFDRWNLRFPQKSLHGVQNEHVWGDYLTHCRNAYHCFDSAELWDCRYVFQAYNPLKDCVDVQECGDSEQLYECAFMGYHCHHVLCTTLSPGGSLSDVLYSITCLHCTQLFGCVGLRRKQHCVLNKQYSKEEYEQLVPAIIDHMKKTGEWGEFFPVALSTFPYNETLAQEYFPLTKEEVIRRGWKWRDQIDEIPKVDRIIPAERLPDSIDGVPDDVLNWAIKCEATKRPFRIIRQELDFYRKQRLPVSHLHPDERHRRRMALRNPRRLWSRKCDKCGKDIHTTYAPDRPETVYCEECYLQAVY